MTHKKRWGLLLILMGIIGILAMSLIEKEAPVYEIQITSDGVSESIKSWYDEESRQSYLFLPSYADNASLTYDENFAVGNNVTFAGSANVSTMYISTATGSMDQVYEDKNHKEPVSVVMYSEDGKLEYQGEDVKIKGHGTSSWNAEKKPFKLIFEDSISLDGLGEGTEWILQANAYDHSNLKNAVVMDTAEKIGIDAVSEYRYVDVYLNGEYNGLYTLVQSVPDILSGITGDEDTYLVVADSNGESGEESDNCFRINDSVTAELKLPEEISDIDLEEIENRLQETDAVITGETEGSLEDYIDIDSWAEKYLIDEIFENFDAGVRSNYFYWTSDGGDNIQVKAGPLWDYDISMGTIGRAIADPNILYASQYQRSSSVQILWYGYLYNNEVFYHYVVQKYRDEFRDVLLQMSGNGIADLAERIQQAVAVNNVRWNVTDSTGASDLVSWLKSRIEFLDSIWLDGDSYVMVTIDPGGTYEYLRCYVKKGECLKDSPMFETYFGEAGSDWRNAVTNEKIDFSAPLYENMTVRDAHSDTDSIVTKLYNNRDALLALFGIGVLGTGMIILLLLDLRRNRSEKGKYPWRKR